MNRYDDNRIPWGRWISTIIGAAFIAGVALLLLGGNALLLLATSILGWVLLVGRMMADSARRVLPALDRTPRAATVVGHREVGDNNSRLTVIDYTAADGTTHRADLADQIADSDADRFPAGTSIRVHAFRDPDLAESVVFLTRDYDDVVRDGYWLNGIWTGQNGENFPAAAGSPFLREKSRWTFAVPEPKPQNTAATPHRLGVRGARILCISAWIVAGLGMAFTGLAGIFTSTANIETGGISFLVCAGIAIGAMAIDIRTADRRGTATGWAWVRLIGIIVGGLGIGELVRTLPFGFDPAVGMWECIVGFGILLIPAAGGLIRRGTGGHTADRDQRQLRQMFVCWLVPPLLFGAMFGIGRVLWIAATPTAPSAGIAIGEVSYFHGDDEVHEVVVVPYKVSPPFAGDGARVAAIDLTDGELLWDEKLDSDPWEGYPVAVTSIRADATLPSIERVQIRTENGAFDFDLEYGDSECHDPVDVQQATCIDEGLGLLADTGAPRWEGVDLYGRQPDGVSLTATGGTVLDPATGLPAGDGFTLAADDSLRLVVDGRTVAYLDDVRNVQQVLTAPSGRVVLLMAGDHEKGVVVIADRTGLTAVTVGERGYIPWPSPFGSEW